MTQKSLTIGRLAEQAQVNVETIRYHQRIGILKEPAKPLEGFREYPSEYVARVKFIKRAQELGFTLKETRDLLELGDGKCTEVQQIVEQKYIQVEERIKDLSRMKNALKGLITQCKSNRDKPSCALIETLNK